MTSQNAAQTQSVFERETKNVTAPLSERKSEVTPLRHQRHDHHDHHDNLSITTGSDEDGRGLMMGAPPTPFAGMGDKPWAVAFTVNVAITLLSAVYFFPNALTVLVPMVKPIGWEASDTVTWMFILGLFGGASAVAASLAVLFLSRYITRLQIAVGVYALVLVVVIRILPDDLLGPVGWTLPVACALIACCVFRPSRLRFAEANLKVATFAVSSTPQIFCWAFCATVARYAWLTVGIVACVGSMAAFTPVASDSVTYPGPWVLAGLSWGCCAGLVPQCDDGSTPVMLSMFWTASILWSSSVGSNVVAATVADAVAIRWSLPDNLDTAWESCNRVVYSSLGSLCKVAAFDCLSHPLRLLVGRLSHASWVADILMLCLRFAVSYVLLQPVVFVGIYRQSVAEAVRQARAMFRTHDRTLFMNDAVVMASLSFLFMAASAIPAILTLYYFVGSLWVASPSPGVLEIVLICTMVAAFATLEVVLFAVKTVFVCLAQVPEVLAENHDRSPHNDLYKTWRELQLLHPATTGVQGHVQV